MHCAGPSAAATTCASVRAGLSAATASSSAPTPLAAPPAASSQEPTLIGEVTLKTRNMFSIRSGRPRSLTSSTGLTASAAAPM